MAGFPELRRALTDAAFATFGEDAAWSGRAQPVRIRVKGKDEDDRFGSVSLTRRTVVVLVRSWELTPAQGDIVIIANPAVAGSWRVKARPMRDGKGVWVCSVEEVE
jgi:hypothetical protein